jgi:phosphatidylglycerophosphatase A
MVFSRQTVMFCATGGFVGNLPLAPGTFGSLLGLPICFFLTKLPVAVSVVLGSLFVFRCLDIVKPFPIRWLERRLSGGFGIVADDILAGLMANIIIRCIIIILK